MKWLFSAIAIFLFCLQIQAHPRGYIKLQPVRPNVVLLRPACPSPGYIWMDGEWRWNPCTRTYEWMEGRWIPQRRAVKWIPGRWKQTHHGYYWVPGHWKQYR